MIKGTGGDTDERRKIEFEIAPYYSINYTPKDEFGHVFFSEWNIEDWKKFDNLLIRAVAHFMVHGISPPPQINLKENKLKQSTNPEFIIFMDSSFELNTAYNKADLLAEFQKICPSQKFISAITFKKFIDKWGEARGYSLNHFKSNGQAMLIISQVKQLNYEKEQE